MIDISCWWEVLLAVVIVLIISCILTVGVGYLFAVGMRLGGF